MSKIFTASPTTPPPFSREQFLLRSFDAIHHGKVRSRSSSGGNDSSSVAASPTKKHAPLRRRRVTIDGAPAPIIGLSRPVLSRRGRRAASPTLANADLLLPSLPPMPPLPFVTEGCEQARLLHRDESSSSTSRTKESSVSSNARPAKKSTRRATVESENSTRTRELSVYSNATQSATFTSRTKESSVHSNATHPSKKSTRRAASIDAGRAHDLVARQLEQHMLRRIRDADTTRRTSDASASDSSSSKSSTQASAPKQYKGFRKDYKIGNTLRDLSDMSSAPQTAALVASLRKHDFAFVRRSNGSFSYAILAYRTAVPAKGSNEVEEGLVFVMNETGSTKIVRKSRWGECIRLASPEESKISAPTPPPTAAVLPKPILKITAGPILCPPTLEDQLKQSSMYLCQEVSNPVIRRRRRTSFRT